MTDAAKNFMEDPEALVDVVREVVEGLRAEASNGNVREAEGQLREVSRAIEKMEKKGLPVTDHLRRAKMDLVAQIDEQREAEDRIEALVSGLSEVLGVASTSKRTRSGEGGFGPGPRLPKQRLHDVVLQILNDADGMLHRSEAYDRMETILKNEFLAGDLAEDQRGRVSWKFRTGWIIHELKKEGLILRSEPNGTAPRGYWVYASKEVGGG